MSRSIAVAYSLKKKKKKEDNKKYDRGDESKQKGIHKTNYEGKGNSAAGSIAKAAHKGNTSLSKEELLDMAKDEHKRVLSEMKSDKQDRKNLASGGTVESGDETMNLSEGGCVCGTPGCKGCSVVDRAMKKYSKGGRVANETRDNSADEMPNEFDDLVLRDNLEDNSGPGNEKGGPDKDDLVARAMLKRKKK